MRRARESQLSRSWAATITAAAVAVVAAVAAVVSPALAQRDPIATGPRDILHAGEIGPVRFGESPSRAIQELDFLLRHRPDQRFHLDQACTVDHSVAWPGLVLFFSHQRLVGYSYRTANGGHRMPTLATAKGLEVGDPLTEGRRLYGQAFHESAYHGGSWWATTRSGQIEGYLAGWPTGSRGSVASIAAGDVGWPASTP